MKSDSSNVGSVGQRVQNGSLSNFDNDLDPVGVKPGPTGWTGAVAERETFF